MERKLDKGPHTNRRSKKGRWFARFLAAVTMAGGSTLGGEPPAAAQFRKDIQPILESYCYDCHADGVTKGGLAFDEFKSDEALLHPDLWFAVLKNTRAGLMPPQNKPQPADEDRQKLERWIKYSAFGIDPKNVDPGRVTVRRLNRVEYRNTVRDLLGINFNTDLEFPPDDTGYGFDNIGDVLTISPMLLEKYLAAAKSIVAEAVPTSSGVLPELTIAGNQFRGRTEAASGEGGRSGRRGGPVYLAYDSPAAISNSFRATQTGNYRLTVNLTVSGPPANDPARCRVLFKSDDQELLDKEFGWEVNKTILLDYEQRWEPGEHRLVFDLQPLVPSDKGSNALQIRVNSVTVRGPMEKQYWPKPANYDRFFPQTVPIAMKERQQYARELLGDFAQKAFRRPVDTKTVDRLVTVAEGVYSQPDKTFEAGAAHAMVAVLASPRFLFRIEENVNGDSSVNWSLVDEYSLASRLSYFLWSSMPDEALYALAERGELRRNLSTQVTRMLADSRSEALVVNFTGQWLQARDVSSLNINARSVFAREATPPSAEESATMTNAVVGGGVSSNLVSVANTPSTGVAANRRLNFGNSNRRGPPPPVELNGDMKNSMRKEIEMFFANIIHEDRPVLELIQSDYIFVNSDLAKIYGLTNLNIQGDELRRITLPPDSPRGGLLTAGAVLAVTSTPERTSPVKRGLFVLNNFVGLPVPPPPPDIPALEVAEKDFHGRQPTLREALELHRESALCASCHARMDPIGLGMENFNALGVWREKERGQTIETAGKLVTGETFNSVQELKNILVTKHKTDFYRCLTEKLLTYALGRGTEYYDTETVDQIVTRIERENGRFSALLNGIIESAPFQKQRNRANPTLSDNRESSGPDNTAQAATRKKSL